LDHAHHVASGLTLDFPLLFLTGLTVSLGHCVGMCGPLQSAVVLRWQEAAGRRPGFFSRILPYHLARVASYVLIGGTFALLGTAAGLTGDAPRWQGILSIAAGALMAPVALGLLGVLPPQKWAELRGVGDRFARRFLALGSGKAPGAWTLGMANGFLPCGPVLAAALAAAPRPVGEGMLLMAGYGAGTLPVLIVLGLAAARIPHRGRLRFHRLSGVFVLLVAAQLVIRGLAAFALVPHVNAGPFMLW
jgi:sulfite exporter TauE/SafE